VQDHLRLSLQQFPARSQEVAKNVKEVKGLTEYK